MEAKSSGSSRRVVGAEEADNPGNSVRTAEFPDMRDISDLPISASAILPDADILLTGDKDFDEIKIYKPLILNPSRYYELF